MRFPFLPAASALGALALLALTPTARAQNYTIWTGTTATTATGTIADPGGPITVNLSFTGSTGFDQIFGTVDSSGFGTYFGSQTNADIFEPDPPGTDDFLNAVAGSDTALYILTFSRPVLNPSFHIFNVDFRTFNFLGGVTPTVVSGLNLAAAGSVVGDNNGTNFDTGGSNKGNPTGSAYGSFLLPGTFTTLQWNRVLVSGAPSTTDGYGLGISVAPQADVPEPGTLALLGTGLLPLAGAVMKRRRA